MSEPGGDSIASFSRTLQLHHTVSFGTYPDIAVTVFEQGINDSETVGTGYLAA